MRGFSLVILKYSVTKQWVAINDVGQWTQRHMYMKMDIEGLIPMNTEECLSVFSNVCSLLSTL